MKDRDSQMVCTVALGRRIFALQVLLCRLVQKTVSCFLCLNLVLVLRLGLLLLLLLLVEVLLSRAASLRHPGGIRHGGLEVH